MTTLFLRVRFSVWRVIVWDAGLIFGMFSAENEIKSSTIILMSKKCDGFLKFFEWRIHLMWQLKHAGKCAAFANVAGNF